MKHIKKHFREGKAYTLIKYLFHISYRINIAKEFSFNIFFSWVLYESHYEKISDLSLVPLEPFYLVFSLQITASGLLYFAFNPEKDV